MRYILNMFSTCFLAPGFIIRAEEFLKERRKNIFVRSLGNGPDGQHCGPRAENEEDLTGKQARWPELIVEFGSDLTIEHCPGRSCVSVLAFVIAIDADNMGYALCAAKDDCG